MWHIRLCLVSCQSTEMQIQQVWAIGKKNAAATWSLKLTKTIPNKHNGVIEPCCNNFEAVMPNYAAITQNYAAITPPLLHQNTPQLRNKSLFNWPDRGISKKNVAVQTCKLIPEQQQELQLSVGLVRNITSLFQLHWDKWVKVPDQDVVKPEKCWNHVLQLLARFLFRSKKRRSRNPKMPQVWNYAAAWVEDTFSKKCFKRVSIGIAKKLDFEASP